MSSFEDTDVDVEERTMELEALEAIFMDDLVVEEAAGPEEVLRCSITLAPDEDEQHVSAVMGVSAPRGYPTLATPTFEIRSVKGLLKTHACEILECATAKAAESAGEVCVFEVATAVRDWLGEHNSADLADDSMYANMLRRDEAARVAKEPKKKVEKKQYGEESDEARKIRETEEAEVRRLDRLRWGTPVTPESFAKWREEFHRSLMSAEEVVKDSDKKSKMTGREFFERGGKFEAEEEEEEEDGIAGPLDATLFVDDDDLEDLDFDEDEDDDEDETDEDEP